MQQVCRLVGHQELRTVGGSQNQRSRRAQPSHHYRVFAGNFSLVQQAADLALIASGCNRRFNRDRQSIQRTARLVRLVKLPRLHAHTFRVKIGKRIELRIEPLDLPNVCLSQLRN